MGPCLSSIRVLLRDDRGQDLIEYALAAALVAVVAIGAVGAFGAEVDSWWSDVAATMDAALP